MGFRFEEVCPVFSENLEVEDEWQGRARMREECHFCVE